jgi:hypothetical protein
VQLFLENLAGIQISKGDFVAVKPTKERTNKIKSDLLQMWNTGSTLAKSWPVEVAVLCKA